MPVEQVRREQRLGVQRRAASSATYDAGARTVELTAATDALVRMPGWKIGIPEDSYFEVLDMSPEAVDLSEVERGNCPLLDSHARWSLDDRLGVVDAARVEGSSLITLARFGQSDTARAVEAEVAADTAPKVSVGYRIEQLRFERYEGEVPVYRATRWKLTEVSFVPIAADSNAGVRADHGLSPCIIMENRAMPPENQPAGTPAQTAVQTIEQTRAQISAASITGQGALATVAGLSAAEVLTAQNFARGLGVEEQITPLLTRADSTAASVNAAILEAAAARQAAGALPAASAGRVTQDERQVQGEAMVEALVSRMTMSAPTDRARQYRGFRIVDLMAERSGISARDPLDIFQRAVHTTSDFPLLLEAAANKALLAAYTAATPTYRALAERKSFADFKPHKFLRIGEFPDLLPVGEAGEVKSGTITESREASSISTKGRVVSLSRQAIINDDLGAFADLTRAAGQAAARSENTAFFALLAANGALSDGVAMFHATHGNLAAAGGAIATNTVGAGRAAMRKQKNIGGAETLNIAPSILLVGPDQETAAEQFVSAINPVVAGEVNPFSGKLTVVVDAQITGNAWYLLAAPSVLPNFIYGYLRDQEGPMITQDTPFGVDGVALKVLHDFGVGALDYRGAYKNPGQA